MLTLVKKALATLTLTLMIGPLVIAQQEASSAQAAPTTIDRRFKNKIFDIKYRDPNSLISVLRQLGSGQPGSDMSGNPEFRTLSVRDFPENLVVIEEALKRLDTPAVPRPDIELHMHILIASNEAGGSDQFPAELKDVLTQLRATLMYNNYQLATTVVQRLKETRRNITGHGTAGISRAGLIDKLTMPFEYGINTLSLATAPSGVTMVQMEEFKFQSFAEDKRASFQTALNIRDGEKVVVGTASIKDKAIIVVLTARLIK